MISSEKIMEASFRIVGYGSRFKVQASGLKFKVREAHGNKPARATGSSSQNEEGGMQKSEGKKQEKGWKPDANCANGRECDGATLFRLKA